MFPLPSELLSLSAEAAALLRDRRLVYANAAARSVLGEDCVGKDIRALFGSEIAEAQAPSFAATATVGGRSRLLRFSRAEGMQIVFFSDTDREPEVFGEASLLALRSELMNLSLAADRARELGDRLGGELPACVAAMDRAVFRLKRLLSNLSTARAVLTEDLSPAPVTLDLGAMISDLVDSLSILRPDVAFSFKAERRVLLWADPQLMELMLMNLLSNCLCHAEGLRQVRLELLGRGDRVYLTVRDDGCGIPPEKMAGLFHRYRAARELRDLSGGAGLGLTVIRGIAEAHGGALLLESREGAGTMLRLSLRRAPEGKTLLAEDAAPYAGSIESLLTGLADSLPDECYRVQYRD